MLRNSDFAKEFEALKPDYELARNIIRRRQERGLTQKELADWMEMTQSVVSRLESGRASPSLATLRKVVKALDSKVVTRIE